VKMLRSEVSTAHQYFSNSLDSSEQLDVENFASKMEKYSKDITEGYERLEAEAKQLPPQTPALAAANRLSGFLLDTATNTNSMETYTNATDAFDWSNSTVTYINFLYEFLKSSSGGSQRGRKFSLVQSSTERTLHPPTVYTLANNPQKTFEETFHQYIKSQENQKIRYAYKYLERSATSCILEIRLMSYSNPREYVTVDRQPVCMLKFMLLVNNGSFEYIQFIAPHEDWTYLETNKVQIDLSTESRYEVYQRLTVQGNIVLNMISTQSATYEMKSIISILLNAVARFRSLDQPCRQCKKILKDFCPTTVSDTKKIFFHPTCC